MPQLVQSCYWTPSTGLPALAKLGQATTPTVALALQRLRNLYWPTTSVPQALGIKPRARQPLLISLRTSELVPDSGYASADSDDEGEDECNFRARASSKYPPATSSQSSIPHGHIDSEESESDDDIDLIRSDVLERTFAIKWITGFISRSDVWLAAIYADADQDDEIEARSQLIDIASQILSAFSSVEPEDDEAASIIRTFSFSVGVEESKMLDVQLNDAALLSEDHTSVGLQSWGSAIILAERICKAPDLFGFNTSSERKLRVLELGAGTGLLSIVAAKLSPSSTVVATDYHPDVLFNLCLNVDSNFPRAPLHDGVSVHKLDWESPSFEAPFDQPFDVILAADVVYNPLHAQWIHDCVERLLMKPGSDDNHGGRSGDGGVGVFWLIIPLRSIGRHEGLYETVDSVFGDAKRQRGSETGWKLAILERQELQRHAGGVGRVDEAGYRLFKIGWARG
ncbi:hypothetical protein CCMSSC00406_0009573 [Pleurotus cornucopiae]|uniref:Uncharacterized protein n=1 Tax=Pleurotus cornucopiae TaxID=5321 RepID=A0ACB7IV98_PLECO|nr:hypothetical protein CCMSSC00406_0009573 [Pleurotus cornucopiae]